MAGSTSRDSAPLESPDTGGSATSRLRSDNTRGPTLPITDHLAPGQRIELWLNNLNQPDFPLENVSKLSSEAARLATHEIPCFYEDWPTMMKASKGTHYNNIIESLNKSFVFVNGDEDKGMNYKYVRDKVNVAWRTHKGKLKKDYVASKDPEIVKMKAPDGIPLEDWKLFVNHCHLEAFKAKSARNVENRAKQIEPNCGGRTPAQVYRHKIAEEQGVSVDEVDRGDMYDVMHTHKKTGTPQRQGLAEKISQQRSSSNSNTTSNSNFEACDNDVVTEVVGKDSRGRMRVMGAGVSMSSFKHSAPYRKRYHKQVKVTEELQDKFEKRINELKDSFDGINQTVQNLVRGMPPTSNSPARASGPSYAGSYDIVSQGPNYMNAEVDVRAFWPLKKVASGRVKQVDPTYKFGNRTLGDGNLLVYIEAITEGSCQLPEPYNHFRTLGEVGQGNVIWPKECLQLLSPRC